MATLVYVVDDEEIIATTLAAILTTNGFEAIPFSNPLDALTSAHTKTPDLLITDVVMPHMSGVSLGVRFKAKFPECRVLLFSGQAATRDLLETARINGHHFDILAKPIHPADLLAAAKTNHSGERSAMRPKVDAPQGISA